MANKILVTGKYLNVLHSVGTKSSRKSVDLENESGINSTLNRESPVKLIRCIKKTWTRLKSLRFLFKSAELDDGPIAPINSTFACPQALFFDRPR